MSYTLKIVHIPYLIVSNNGNIAYKLYTLQVGQLRFIGWKNCAVTWLLISSETRTEVQTSYWHAGQCAGNPECGGCPLPTSPFSLHLWLSSASLFPVCPCPLVAGSFAGSGPLFASWLLQLLASLLCPDMGWEQQCLCSVTLLWNFPLVIISPLQGRVCLVCSDHASIWTSVPFSAGPCQQLREKPCTLHDRELGNKALVLTLHLDHELVR